MWKRSARTGILLCGIATAGTILQGSMTGKGTDSGNTGELAAGLVIVQSSGVKLGGGAGELLDRVPTQADPKLIVLEAEDAAYIDPQGDAAAHRSGRNKDAGGVTQVYAGETKPYEPGKDPKASGGAYIDFADQISMDFNVTQPGQYYRWVRYYIAWDGNWSYQAQVGDGPVQVIRLQNLKIKDYFWNRDPEPYALAAGTHKHNCLYVHGGKRIDKVVFCSDPEWKPDPDGVGPDKSPIEFIREGTVTTGAFKPASALLWKHLIVPGARKGGEIKSEVSSDGGKTFKAVAGNGDLSFLGRPKGDGEDELRFRFTISRKEGQPSPILEMPTVVYEADPEAFLVIEDDSIRVMVDKKTGSLAGVVNKAGGLSVTKAGIPTSMMSVVVKKQNDRPVAISWDKIKLSSVSGGGNSITADYSADTPEGQLALQTEIELLGEGRVGMNVSIDNRSAFDVMEIEYPSIQGVKLGESSGDDVLVWPYHAGQFHLAPCQSGSMNIGYPAGMGWIDIFDDKGGFYLGSHEPFVVATDIRSVADTALERVTLGFAKKHRVKPGESRTYRYVAAAHKGDWHDGADIYREWFYSAFGHPILPQWLSDSVGWMAGSSFKATPPQHYTEIRNGILDTALALGLTYSQIWGETWNGACPTYYLPRKECGGEAEFAKNNTWWRGLGNHIGYYFHGNSTGYSYVLANGEITPDELKSMRPAFDEFVKTKNIANPDVLWKERFEKNLHNYFGTPWSEYPANLRPMDWDTYVKNRSYPSEDYKLERAGCLKDFAKRQAAVMSSNSEDDYSRFAACSKTFDDFLRFWTVRYIRDYGCDTVYYDTMGFGCENPEFNPYLGQHGEGDATMHRLRLLDAFYADCRPIAPSFTCLVEGVGDVWGTRMYMLLSGFARNPEIFRYTFPDMVMFQGHANGYWSNPKADESIREAFMLGNKFDILHGTTVLRDLIHIRHQLGPWATRGIFKDSKGLAVADTRVNAKGSLIDQGGSKGILLTFNNFSKLSGVKAAVDLDLYGISPRSAWLFEPGKDPVRLAGCTRDGKLNLMASGCEASAVLLIDKVQGEFAVTVAARSYLKEDAIPVEIMNYTDHSVTAEVRLEGGEIKASKPPRPMDLAANSLTRLEIATTGVDGRTMVEAGLLKLTTAGCQAAPALVSLMPRIKDPGFEYFVLPGTTGQKPLEGKRALDAAKGGASLPIFLESGKTFDIKAMVLPDAKGQIPAVTVVQGGSRVALQKSDAPAKDGWLELVAKGVKGEGYTPDNWEVPRVLKIGHVKNAAGPILVDAIDAMLVK